ncbi:glycosyltransferase family 9 protein [Puia dinghuensis]|uniref:Glycosyl transferase n=1 Tax=Puia dinghuensis TaxID=1792502 RepID=A0A8J2XT26_9BACT|nr:glycosyltransferase family 9 protein [Puia dinghuensis]GGA99932.1 glycosyl transferase [Puia dinghuensis]
MRIRLKQKIDWYAGYGLTAILLPITRLLGIVLRRDHSLSKPPRRLLFIKLMGLGSLVVASEAITAMRRRFPNTRFILLTDSNIADGIAPFQLFDEIVQTDTNRLFSTARRMVRFFARSWTWRSLWVVDLEVYSKLTTVLALLTLARNRFGFYLPPVPLRKYLNTHNIPFDRSTYLEANYTTMARSITGVPQLAMEAPPPRTGERYKPYILLNNTCSSLAAVRKLPDSTFSAICRWLLENTPYHLALLGAPEDKRSIDRFINEDAGLFHQQDRILNYAGVAKDFGEYYQFLGEYGVCLITIDSGPLHIARKLGLPTLSIWGPTDPAHYLNIPPDDRHRHLVHYLGVPCSPCVHRYPTPPCGGDNVCMKNSLPSAIIKKIETLLAHLSLPQPV